MRKVYAMCPAYLSTGGTELLHQLVYKLIHVFKIEAYVFYTNVEWKYEFDPTPAKFVKYVGRNWVESLDDSADHILIIPETMSVNIDRYKHMQLWIWWLSIDNFFVTIGKSYTYQKYNHPNLEGLFRKMFKLKPYKNLNTILHQQNIKLHLYQSEYARLFLKRNKIRNLHPLSDYTDSSVVNSTTLVNQKRLDQVLYNPIKGFEITNHLIRNFPEIKWVPIVKMKPAEVGTLMANSKVYVDFGNHPGKDRIPREAVLNGCCIIVNKEGAAKNDLDVAIPAEFKIDNPLKEQNRVVTLIRNIFEFYDENYSKFKNYHLQLMQEETIFEKEIRQLISYIEN